MTIGGVNIWTHKFFLASVSGLFNQPARKKTLSENGTEAKDIQHKNKVITVELAADYDTAAALQSGVGWLTTAIGTGEKTFVLPNYGKTIKGVVKGGANFETPESGLIVKAKFKITVTDELAT